MFCCYGEVVAVAVALVDWASERSIPGSDRDMLIGGGQVHYGGDHRVI